MSEHLPARALRLTFVKEGDHLRLKSEIEVDAMVPAGHGAAQPHERGFWLELQDASDRLLYRRVLENPLPQDAEVFSPDAKESIVRVPGATRDRVFSVLVPNAPEAVALALFSSEHVGHPIDSTSARLSFAARPTGRFVARPAALIARFAIKGGAGGRHGNR